MCKLVAVMTPAAQAVDDPDAAPQDAGPMDRQGGRPSPGEFGRREHDAILVAVGMPSSRRRGAP
jgi:hypothetical protein